MKLNRTLLGAASLAGALTVAVGGSAFAASDTNPTLTSTYVAVGSDTTDDVIGALSTTLVDGSNTPYISSYSAFGSATITIPARSYGNANANCTITRPNGSGAGLRALGAGVLNVAAPGQTTGTADNCVQLGRSSSGANPGTGFNPPAGSLTYIPFGTDSVSYATLGSSVFSHNLNLDRLKTIYRTNGVPGTSDCGGALGKWAPLIPQSGSGTRGFWATVLGITDGAIDTTKAAGTAPDNTWGSCVRDTVGGNPVQEHDGRVLTANNQIAPFSTAQFIAQAAAVIPDNRGARTTLNAIDFDNNTGATSVSPFVLQQSFKSGTVAANNGSRPVYNVVQTSRLASDSRLSGLLSGPTSVLCNNAASKTIIQRYGFDLNPSCGDTTKVNS